MLTIVHNLFDWAPLGLPAFAFVFTIVVFFHELGHFLMARACGVAVETFSIGFGSEIFGWTDRKGTRWKVCWLPLGGYVKFLGDENVASTAPDKESVDQMKAEERSQVLFFKPLYQRALVAAAGPGANFVLAFIVFFVLFGVVGAKALGTSVGSVTPNSPAQMAGIKVGDKITAINGHKVEIFADLHDLIEEGHGKPLAVSIERNGHPLVVNITARSLNGKDVFGTPVKYVGIGIGYDVSPENSVYVPVSLVKAPLLAAAQCWGIVDMSMTYLWRIVSHHADASGLGGPVGIAQMAKSAASQGFYDLIYLVAFISVSLGLANLFPIPLLDGGHLLYYAFEGVLGKPLDERTQIVGFKVGLAVLVTLFVFLTWNDLIR